MGRLEFSSFLFLFLFCCCQKLQAQVSIPANYDGFLYKDVAPDGTGKGSVIVEAFLDPICPDSRDSWPPLKKALDYYSPHVALVVHPFALPYHDNSFVACRALHIANKLNESTTYPLLELFFKYQKRYYNKPTERMSRAYIVKHIAELAVKVIGNSSLSAFENGFEDSKTDMAARISFKYGCSRGVTGTPYFFVNGFPLPGSGSALDYEKWKSVIDPLLAEQREMGMEVMGRAYE